MVLRELKNHPHRIIYMGLGDETELLLTNQKGDKKEVQANQFPIADRTSNGSFVLDEKSGGTIVSVVELPNKLL